MSTGKEPLRIAVAAVSVATAHSADIGVSPAGRSLGAAGSAPTQGLPDAAISRALMDRQPALAI